MSVFTPRQLRPAAGPWLALLIGLMLLPAPRLAAADEAELKEFADLIYAWKNDDVMARIKTHPELLNVILKGGYTPLSLASQEGNLRLTRALLELNPQLDVKDDEGQTALIRASKNNAFEVVKLLVAKGANLQLKEMYGMTAEAMARSRNHNDIADFLKGVLEGTVAPGGLNGLFRAIQAGDLAQVQALLTATPGLAVQLDPAGRTPLHAAVLGQSDIAACLLEKKVDPNKADADQWRPLHIAAEAGRADMVKLLLEHQANPNVAATPGAQTPLYIAALYGFTAVVRDLLAAQADPNQAAAGGITPLHRAAAAGYTDIVSLLILDKADLNPQDSQGRTPLDYALAARQAAVAKLLQDQGATGTQPAPPGPLAPPTPGLPTAPTAPTAPATPGAKADPTAKLDPAKEKAFLEACNRADYPQIDALLQEDINIALAKDPANGYNALHHLVYRGTPEYLKKLIALGVMLDAPHKYGRTPLHRAAEFGNAAAVKLLLDMGAKINAVDNDGRTPLHHAAKNAEDEPKFRQTLEYLLTHDPKPDASLNDIDGLTPYGEARKYSRTLALEILEAHGIKE